VRHRLLERRAGHEAFTSQLPTTQGEGRRRRQPIRQDRERLTAGRANSASDPDGLVLVIVALPEPPSMADDGLRQTKRAPSRQRCQGNYPGSPLSFVSGSAIKRITAGVKARRDRPCQVSIGWSGLHPPGKVSSDEKRILLCIAVRIARTHDIGRFRSTYHSQSPSAGRDLQSTSRAFCGKLTTNSPTSGWCDSTGILTRVLNRECYRRLEKAKHCFRCLGRLGLLI
jgi:hypothetical protein